MVPEADVPSVREAEAVRDPGREVIEKFVKRHGWLTMTSIFLSAGWAEFFMMYFYPDRSEWYIKSARMALTLFMGWITYNLLYAAREVVKLG